MTFEEAYATLDEYKDFNSNCRMYGTLMRMSPVRFSQWVKTLDDHKVMKKLGNNCYPTPEQLLVGKIPDLKGLAGIEMFRYL